MMDTDDEFFYENCDKFIFSKNLERDLLRLDYSLVKLNDKINILNNTIVILSKTDTDNIYTIIENNNKDNMSNLMSLREEIYEELFRNFLHGVNSRIRMKEDLINRITYVENKENVSNKYSSLEGLCIMLVISFLFYYLDIGYIK